MSTRRQRLANWFAHAAPYPWLLQGIVLLTLLATPLSAVEAGSQQLAPEASNFWGLVAICGLHLLLLCLVPVRRLRRWMQLLYLFGQCGLASAAWAAQPTAMLDFVYLSVVLQAIYLFRAWLWIPFSVLVWFIWNGALLVFSTSFVAWVQGNLVLAFPAFCVLLAAIIYARQHRRYEQVQQLANQLQRHYDTLSHTLRDIQQRAALEERRRLAQTITNDLNTALTQVEQQVNAAINQAQTNFARFQGTVAQTRSAAVAMMEQVRTAIATLRHDEPETTQPLAPTMALSADDWLFSTRTSRVLTWLLPLLFVGLAFPLILLTHPVTGWLILNFLIFGSMLVAASVLTQRIAHRADPDPAPAAGPAASNVATRHPLVHRPDCGLSGRGACQHWRSGVALVPRAKRHCHQPAGLWRSMCRCGRAILDGPLAASAPPPGRAEPVPPEPAYQRA
ncbi:MAG: hypothetical protein MUD01_16060 [Chloroflexaceae bacterium]|nr:hypothetical protein [Chloroflexaceae bacterium]